MEVDGPVTPTTKEITEQELQRIYQLAYSGAVVQERYRNGRWLSEMG
jgi:hypothetical protein